MRDEDTQSPASALDDGISGREESPATPNFFIVGGPRCGTTSLTRWLAQHPDVFMPEVKVPFHFGTDLDMVNKRQFRALDTYLELFASVQGERRIGESTPFYLFSKDAAKEIHEFEPDARIIILLRNPADMMYSMHARNLADGNEDIQDFAEALAAEAYRKAGERLPTGCFFRQSLYYRDLARFPEQLKRYLRLYHPEQIHVIIFDDLISAPQATLDGVLRFLGLEPCADIELVRANKSVAVRSPALAALLRRVPGVFQRLPFRLWQRLVWRINRWNKGTKKLPGLDRRLRRELQEEYAPAVQETGRMLKRDLSHWLR